MRSTTLMSAACAAVMLLAGTSRDVNAQVRSTPSQDVIITRLSQFTDSLAKLDEFNGVVALVRNGKTVFEHAYGYADRASKKPNTLETQFDLGSINKIFTATSIRQLVAAGKIDLDSTFIHYLPEYPNRAVASSVTVRQLLSMKAGLGGDIFGTPASGKRSDIRKLADFVPLFANEAPIFAPGTKSQYCNACFVLLGLIIEKASGQSYYDYVQTHIYEPAGMKHTMHLRSDDLPASAAIGYTRHPPQDENAIVPLHANTTELPGIGSSAGGGYSTAGDLLRFVAALRVHAIPQGPDAGNVGIAGGAPGMNGDLEGGMAGEYDLVILANMDPPAAQNIARMMRLLLGAGG